MTCVGKVQINFFKLKNNFILSSGTFRKFPFLFYNALQFFFFSIFSHSSCTNKWKTTSFNRRSRSVFFYTQFFFFTLNLSFLPVRGKQAQLKHEERKEKSCKLNSFAQHRANKKNERKRLNCIYLQFCSILFLLPPPPPLSFVLFTCHSHFTCWHFTAMVQNWKFIFFISLARSLTHIQHL